MPNTLATRIVALIAFFLPALSWGHVLLAPEVVEAEQDGSFHVEALFRVGPGPESLAFYAVEGQDNVDLDAYVADGECVSTLHEGDEIDILVHGSLLDLRQSGTARVKLMTCGVSGTQTVFEALLTIAPPRMHSLYWIENQAIWRGTSDGIRRKLVAGAAAADAMGQMDLDPIEGMLYWAADDGSFFGIRRRVNRYGGAIEDHGGNAGGISIDWPSRMLYMTDPSDCTPGCGSMWRVRLDLTGSEPLLFELDLPGGIEADGSTNNLCWAEEWPAVSSKYVIRCATLDARDIVDVAIGPGFVPSYVEIDPVMGKVYWTDPGRPGISRANPDGLHVEPLVTTPDEPKGFTLDHAARKMIWTESGAMRRANLDGSDVEDLMTDLDSASAVVVDDGAGSIEIELDSDSIEWSPVPGVAAFDVVRGSLGLLASTHGNFAAATAECVAESTTSTELSYGGGAEIQASSLATAARSSRRR